MSFIKALGISATGLYAQKKRIELVSQNIANADTVLTEDGTPYQRKVAVLGENKNYRDFSTSLDRFSRPLENSGVKVTNILNDDRPPKIVYDPDHPLATEDGYISLPNIDTTEEMLDLLAASRAYEANTTVLNTTKSMFAKSLEIVR
jgi:flagellar basal-body rod protein FlgC